jgi:beta-galactosidase
MKLVSALLLISFFAGIAGAGTLSNVALDEPGLPDHSAHFIGGEQYTFSSAEVPDDVLADNDPLRLVMFGSRVRLGYSGAKAGATYVARFVFVSEVPRTISIEANSDVLTAALKIPPGRVVRVEYQVKPDPAGEIALQLRCVEGPNAVVSRVEIVSDDPTPLLPIKDPNKAARERLAAMIASIPAEPARLSPRPEKVSGVTVPIVSLNGEWQFTAFPVAVFDSGSAAASTGWKPIAVPGEWVMQGFTVPAQSMGCYQRELEIPSDWKGERIKLRFDSVNSDCRVWVNGHLVGSHEGGFVPFEFDITDALQAGQNKLLVAAEAETISDTLGSVSQYAAHPVGGILRKVQLFAVPPVNLASEIVSTPLQDGGRAASLDVDVALAADVRGASPAGTKIELALTSPEGKPVQLANAAWTAASDITRHAFAIPVAQAELWDSEHPRLYVLTTTLSRGGITTESVSRKIGTRQIEIDGNQLLVNFHPVKLLGVCRHEITPLGGRSVPSAVCREDARLFRDANCNYIRTSHYPPSEEFLDAADELGLFVEDESALCWIQHNANAFWKTADYQDPRFLPDMLRANLEKMAAGRDHPSVIIWSMGNESYWSPLWAEVQKRVAALDPTRPITFHDQCWGSYDNNHSTAPIGVFHYPGESGPARCDNENRPTLFGEYCHIECYNRRELVTDPGIRNDWGRPFERMVDLMQAHPGCLGGAIWSGIDDIFDLPDGRLVGYGPWGVIDGWRRNKPEYWLVKNAYSPVRVVNRNAPLPDGVTVLRIPVENRYNFTNLKETKIEWAMGTMTGTAAADIPPRSNGVIEIKLPSPTRPGEALVLNVTDPRGFVCESDSLNISAPTPVPSTTAPVVKSESAKFTASPAAFEIASANWRLHVDRTNGAVSVQTTDGTAVVDSLGLMVLPLNDDSGGDGGTAGNDFQNKIAPFTPLCTDWKMKSVSGRQSDGTAEIKIAGTYAEADGSYTLSARPDGRLGIAYDFTVRKKVNPRQWGAVLSVPKHFDRLTWDRDAQWTVYPTDHIGRAIGFAMANPVHRDSVEQPGVRLTRPWSLDANDLGSNDFRSTKYHIRTAGLTDKTGHGLQVESDGSASERAWVDGTQIHLLVAGFDTGGSDEYFAGHFASERRPLAAGTGKVSGSFVFQLVDLKSK